ncbi:endonuclease/exonuclease/phosphatase family protein [Thiomicrorhabdus sp. zzn3]|uniref:endonuclease/exonuclease/phosphatase family protein n=1 Tax=Thiomicrorhabdus sp. zzn3 TaxID=3039775 RepID=UPI002436A073|nr:endonuclease/exonuclease/phosphatase family protein [Thiomicrorhabdus sp. zzn3]MDG6778589.1 endonuclease/exonuclease/phosphatase family protein [Thiomicrorhabdus sp. zzn3]
MYKPKSTPISHSLHLQTVSTPLPACFTLVCWNLQKVDFAHFIHRPIENLLPIDQAQLLSLQEAGAWAQQNKFFDLPFVMAPNIQTRKKHFGVLTASSHSMSAHHQCLTHSRELGWITHKTALITQHRLANDETLTHVNIHAINFVPHRLFKKELQVLWSKLSHLEGPMIVSGDFNTWNKTRLKTLQHAIAQLQLTKVDYPESHAIKTLLRKPLDHIFFRGLKLHSSQVISVPDISDHNPLIATFCVA